jgi:hypothetical protein
VNRKAVRADAVQSNVARHGDDGAGAGADAIHGRDQYLRTGAHRAHEISRHAGEIEQLRRGHPRERSDDLVDVAAGAKISPRAREHHRTHVARVDQRAKQIAQLRVGLEGEGILAFGPIELNEADAVCHAPLKVHGLVIGKG